MIEKLEVAGAMQLEIDLDWFGGSWGGLSLDSYLRKAIRRPKSAARKFACMMDLLGSIVKPPTTVVDLFAGIGVCLKLVQMLWPEARVRAYDIDPVSEQVIKRNFPEVLFFLGDTIEKVTNGADLVLGDFYQFTVLDVLNGTAKARCVKNYLHQRCRYFILTDSAIYRLHLNAGTYARAFSRSVRSPDEYYRLLSDVLGGQFGYGVRRVAYSYEAGYVLFERGYEGTITLTRWR